MWENRSKTCTTYTKFGCCYRQQMWFFTAKEDGEDFTITFHNAYHREYYKLPQWEGKGGANGLVEPIMATAKKHYLWQQSIVFVRRGRNTHWVWLEWQHRVLWEPLDR
jgi:hypothetical protein